MIAIKSGDYFLILYKEHKMKKQHRYLTDNGLPTIDPNKMLGFKFNFRSPIRSFKEWKRVLRYKRIERTKGFNPANTWCMESYFLLSLYEMIEAYLENADTTVDLDYHTFEYEGKTYTQLDLIKLLKEEIKSLFIGGDDSLIEYWYDIGKYDLLRAKEKKILDIWYLILPAMWW